MRGPVTLLKDAWNRTRGNLRLFVLIYLPPTVVAALFGYLSTALFPQDAEGMVSLAYDPAITYGIFVPALIATVVLTFVGSLALLKAVMTPAGMSVASAYRFGSTHIWGFFLLSLLVALATLLGFLLFIIPGIILSVWFLYAQFVFIETAEGGTTAMRKSHALVRGRWWGTFGRTVFLTIVAMAAYLLLGIAVGLAGVFIPGLGWGAEHVLLHLVSLVVTPLAIAYLYGMYRDAKQRVGE